MPRRKSIYRKSREIHRSQTQRVCTDSSQQPNMNRVMMLGNYIHNLIGCTSAQTHHTPSTYTIHFIFFLDCCYSVSKLCLTLCDPLDGSLPSSSVHGISQPRILEWVAIFSLEDLPNSGTKVRSPALQVDSLPLSHQVSPFLDYRGVMSFICPN